MSFTLLVDNDFVVKLAKFDAFAEGVRAIGHSPSAAASMVPMLEYMGINSEARRRRLTTCQAEADRLRDVLGTIEPLELTESQSVSITQVMETILTAELDVDEGELMLLVVAVEASWSDLATGDKRALLALPSLQGYWAAVGQLRERLICLEQAIARLCKHHGVPWVKQRIRAAPEADTTLREAVNHAKGMKDSDFTRLIQHLVKHQLASSLPGWLKNL